MPRVMTKRRGRGHGRKNKRTMRRRRSHSAHLTRSHRHRHGGRARHGGMFSSAARAAAKKVFTADNAIDTADAAIKLKKKYDDAIEGVNRNEALKRTISKKPHHTTQTFGATASSHRPLPSGVSSKLPNRRRSIAAIAANRLVVPSPLVVPGPMSAIHEDEDDLALLTSNKFARSRLGPSGMSSH